MTDYHDYERLADGFGRDLSTAAASQARRRRSLRPRLAATAGGLLAAAALAIAFVLAGAAQPDASPLTPREAVAAVATDLSSDGILHWTTHAATPGNPKRAQRDGDTAQGPRYERWIDLRTGASHNRVRGRTKSLARRGVLSPSWFDGRRTRWVVMGKDWSGLNGRTLVMRTIRRSGEAIPPKENPVLELRQQLSLTPADDARIEDAGTIGGTPIARVIRTEVFEQGTQTITTLITREASPRLIRTTTELSGERPFSATEETDTWEILPRTPASLAKVHVPDFDPDKYVVRTQHLGPPKR